MNGDVKLVFLSDMPITQHHGVQTYAMQLGKGQMVWRLAERTEKKSRGWYHNITLKDLVELTKDSFVIVLASYTCLVDFYMKHRRPDKTFFVFHDWRDGEHFNYQIEPWQFLGVREHPQFDIKVFKQPYTRTGRVVAKTKIACAHTNVVSCKRSHIINQAGCVDIYGKPFRLYAYSKKITTVIFDDPVNTISPYHWDFDLTDFPDQQMRGTQYCQLEAMDALCMPVMDKRWQTDYEYKLIDPTVDAIREVCKETPDYGAIIRNSSRLHHHRPELILQQMTEYMYDQYNSRTIPAASS